MQKDKTQIKHDNLVAQISVLKQELDIVNQELTSKIKERDSLKIELLSDRKELELIRNEYSKFVKQSEDKVRKLDDKERSLNKKSAEMIEQELTFKEKMKVDEKSFGDKIKLYENRLLDYLAKIQLRKQDVEEEKKNVRYYKDLSNDLTKESKTLSQQKYGLEKDIERLKKSLVEDLSELDRQLKQREDKLKNIESVILKEQEKTKLPEINLITKEKELDKKKRNFDILVTRFKRIFKDKYPNQEIKL